MKRDHSVVFEIASKYCISNSFVDHDGHSISSEGFLPTVVDIMVIWVKFTHSSPFQFADSYNVDIHSCHLLFDHFQFPWFMDLTFQVPMQYCSLQHRNFVLSAPFFCNLQFSSVQWLSRVRLFATPWITVHQASLSITNSRSSLKHVRRVSDAIQPSHPLLSPSPPAPNLSQHQSLFQWVNSSHEVAKVSEFQL